MIPIKDAVIKESEFNKNLGELKRQAFMKDLAPHIIGGIPSVLFTLYFFYDLSSQNNKIIWCSSYFFIFLVCGFFYGIHSKRSDFFTMESWVLINHIIVFLLAVFWSMPAFLFLNTSNILYAVILVFQILAMCVSPAAAIIYYPKAYTLFVTLPMLSVFVFLLTNENEYELFFYFLPLSCSVALLIYGLKLRNNVFHALNLQVENSLAWQSAEKANRAKSTFLAAASHDIRQPLQAISLLLEAFDERHQSVHNKNLMEHLKVSVNSMSGLLNSLLDVSRLDAQVVNVSPEHIKIRPFLKKIIQSFEHQNINALVQLEFFCPDQLVAYADPIILERVINNLLDNALQYTDKGEVRLYAEQEKDTIVISVADTGIGIEESEKVIIFDEFYQSKNPNRRGQKGLGLGLSIVKKLCELHQWPISFSSKYLQGSTFRIAIHLGDVAMCKDEIATTPEVKFQDLSVLIIDDEFSVRESLQFLLEAWGCKVDAYENPNHAIADLQHKHIDMPGLIISDYRLGGHQNGIEVINHIRQHINLNIEAILITGDTGIKQIQDAQGSGLLVLHKPVKPAQLRKSIQMKTKRK